MKAKKDLHLWQLPVAFKLMHAKEKKKKKDDII